MDRKNVKQLKDALKTKSDLPVKWECGCDESLVYFEGWAKEKGGWFSKESPYNDALSQLRQRMIELLDLPNAGEVMDEGQGRIFLDELDGSIKLTYSSTCVVYEMPEEIMPEVLRERSDVEVQIDLEAPDFELLFLVKDYLLEDKEVLDLIHCKPEIDHPSKTTLWNRLRPLLPEYGSVHPLQGGIDGMESGKVVSLDVSGSWDSSQKTFKYSLYVGCEYLAHEVNERTVVLAK